MLFFRLSILIREVLSSVSCFLDFFTNSSIS